MEEWFGAPIIEKLINTGFQYLGDQVRWQTGMKEELERLRENHPKIQAVVDFASNEEQIRDRNTALNEWLWQLRDAIEEADDVLDDLEYMKLEKQLTKEKKQRKVRSIMKSINKRLVQIAKRALKIDPNLKRLEKVVQKLDRVSAGVATFLHLVKDAKQEHQEQQLEMYRARETGSLPKNDLIGRGKDKEFVSKWLRNPSNEHQTTLYSNISLLCIVGHGGMGKTALLQQVYKDEMTKEFDLKMWICVSNNFDVNRVIANMLESLRNERACLQTLDALQKNLESEVKSKKFLLVLDDIWDDDKEQDKNKWENVLAPLASGKLGCKILVTTRMESVALMISNVMKKKNEMLRLEGLKDDECLLLLLRYAFVNVETFNAHQNLWPITKKIVTKLSGSPLAARVIGGVLNSHLDESHWIRVLNYDIGSQNDILSVLKLSYIFLPKALRNCLSFCSIFPQDHEFDKDDIVRMWTALDFIQPSDIGGETTKDAAERYFNVLVKKSLFDEFQNKHRTYYKLHDLLHEMVRFVSGQEYFSIVSDEELFIKNPETIRHLYVDTNRTEVFRNMDKFKKLRSLIVRYIWMVPIFDELTKIFKTLKSIRLMSIHAPLEEIPEEIGYLTHLRYLNFVEALMVQLPRSVCNLYHLQFLIHDRESKELDDDDLLPRDLNNLRSLHYLKLSSPGMYEIGKLNALQELDGIYVLNEAGYRIEELEHMNELRKLVIYFLENVKDAKDACKAKLCDKRNLTDLSLEWGSFDRINHNHENVLDNLQPHSCIRKLKTNSFKGTNHESVLDNLRPHSCIRKLKTNSFKGTDHESVLDNLRPHSCIRKLKTNSFKGTDHENVLDNLQPHSCLKKLKINSFKGARSAIWMNNVHLISNLEYIRLEHCTAWKTLPPFWQLPFLKSLYLHDMPEVKDFDYNFHENDKIRVFPSLEVLYIKKLKAMEDWFIAKATAYECLFPCLTKLYLEDCPNLLELPSCPPKLEKLEMNNIGWKDCNWLQGISNNCSISIRNCQNLTYPRGH